MQFWKTYAWTDFKNTCDILISQHGMQYAGNGSAEPYLIWGLLGGRGVQCLIPLTDTADITEFETKYKDVNYNLLGFRYVITGGSSHTFNEKFTTDILLFGGSWEIVGVPTANAQDYLEVRIVDVDNLLGYGAGLILDTLVSTFYIGERKWDDLRRKDSGRRVPAGFYVQIKYISAGSTPTDDVILLSNLEAWS